VLTVRQESTICFWTMAWTAATFMVMLGTGWVSESWFTFLVGIWFWSYPFGLACCLYTIFKGYQRVIPWPWSPSDRRSQ
jgi:hypothetical protein